MPAGKYRIKCRFQSTLPRWSDLTLPPNASRIYIFQSTLPYGSDYEYLSEMPGNIQFQSTLPYGSDYNSFQCLPAANHFNPRSLTGATLFYCELSPRVWISIHAPLRERLMTFKVTCCTTHISIHAPLRERQYVRLLRRQPL